MDLYNVLYVFFFCLEWYLVFGEGKRKLIKKVYLRIMYYNEVSFNLVFFELIEKIGKVMFGCF